MKDSTELSRLPRKLKKMYLGKRLSGSKIRRLLKALVITPPNNGHDSALIEPFEFCPKCGCRAINWTGNKAPYPERWDSGYCARCHYHVAESDNSPYYHVLECEDLTI